MADEKVLIVSDSLEGPTGFASNAANIAWCLANEFDVHVLGLQSVKDNEVVLDFSDDPRQVYQHKNYPRARELWDFGERSVPLLIKELEPDILITVNDIQMVSHIPRTLYKHTMILDLIDMPAKRIRSETDLFGEVRHELIKLKERYPPKTKWIMYAPQDGEPPIPHWYETYYAADEVVAMSKYGQRIFKDYFMMDVDYIYHAVDTKTFYDVGKPEHLQDKFIVGDVNRNQPRKQPIRLIEAFAKFAKDKDDVLLYMQMDWNDRFGWPLIYFVRDVYKIADKCMNPLPPGIPKAKMKEVYSAFDVNVMPTAGEGFGLPTIEAGACSKPTIATDYTTSKELIIDGKPSPRGKLVPYKTLFWDKLDVAAVQRALIDTDKLAKALEYYYENRDALEKHGKNALEWVKKNVEIRVIEKKWIRKVKEVLDRV